MPAISFKFDKAAWNKSIRDVVVATKKDEVDVVNRALLNVAYRAAQYTTKRSADDIRQELLDNKTALRIVTAKLRKTIGSIATIKKGKLAGRTYRVSRITRKQIGEAATKLINRRRASSGASRAGWIPSIKDMGGSFRGEKIHAGGSASKGYGKKATFATLEGLIANAHFGVIRGPQKTANQQSMINALQRAINRVRRENTIYAMKKIGGTLKRHSD